MAKQTVVTHNGNFHADDVFSVAALKSIFPSFELIRTRDLETIAKADIVIDVGGEYDADAGRFDHHQRGGAGERENGIPDLSQLRTGGISAKSIVAKAIENAEDPRVIVLEKYTPWKTTVLKLSEEALYMVYPSQTGQWRIQTVPVEPGSFEDRKPVPSTMGGFIR
ncbi:UPF0160 protein MYG1, mitochondrial [Nymphon striatum]|nr:UPF0160 protein MYG1, mitochondrial [Nymphon striatum]